MAIKYPLLCLVQTSTTGPSAAYAVVETSIKPGYRSLTRATADGSLNDGDQVYYMCRDSTVVNGGNLFEYGIGVWSNSAKTITRPTILQSSNGTTAISWGAGTRDLYVSDTFAGVFLQAANNLSDLANAAAARGNLGLGTAALATTAAAGGGGSAGDVPILDGGGNIPLSMLGNAAAGFPTGTKLPFYQDAAPTGWTIVTSITDKVLKVTKGSGASDTAGGTNDGGIGGWDNSWGITVAGHALTGREVPEAIVSGADWQNFAAGSWGIAAAATGNPHAHGISSSSQWRPPAAYFIIASKN
jgi:hypothetical protein